MIKELFNKQCPLMVIGFTFVLLFVGMHAFQAIPFFAYTMEKYNVKSATFWTTVFAAVYFVFFTFLFVQAMFGKPLFAGF